AGKLARHLASKGRRPVLVACDLQRPAAVEQLRIVAAGAGVAVHAPFTEGDPVPVDEGVAVDVTEAGQRDRQLHPQDAVGDLRDLLGCWLLFLLRVGGGAHALQARRKRRGKRKAPAGSGAALRGSRGCRPGPGGRRPFSARS
ncbi:MAG: hypothetical protein EBY44_03350, partial [Actinobacteria bacterium]|nr:hypothetical protein [Actinomycetota bacterium]